MAVYRFGENPESEFKTGALKGFDREVLSGPDYGTERAHELYESIGADISDGEYVLGLLPDGRFAIVGLTMPGHEFAIED